MSDEIQIDDDVVEFCIPGNEVCQIDTLFADCKKQIGKTIEFAGNRVITDVVLCWNMVFITTRKVKK